MRYPMPGEVLTIEVMGQSSDVTLLAILPGDIFEYSVSGYPRKHPATCTEEAWMGWRARATVIRQAQEQPKSN